MVDIAALSLSSTSSVGFPPSYASSSITSTSMVWSRDRHHFLASFVDCRFHFYLDHDRAVKFDVDNVFIEADPVVTTEPHVSIKLPRKLRSLMSGGSRAWSAPMNRLSSECRSDENWPKAGQVPDSATRLWSVTLGGYAAMGGKQWDSAETTASKVVFSTVEPNIRMEDSAGSVAWDGRIVPRRESESSSFIDGEAVVREKQRCDSDYNILLRCSFL
ncbi:hypothetical protein IW262DRAFT_1462635 [Armillaria fumosa]|nr:hypothetical protein IW262DRAFT_1462635 [Armillaria fumosa]